MKKKLNSTVVLLIALFLGIICGLIFGEKMTFIAPIGDIFLNLNFLLQNLNLHEL